MFQLTENLDLDGIRANSLELITDENLVKNIKNSEDAITLRTTLETASLLVDSGMERLMLRCTHVTVLTVFAESHYCLREKITLDSAVLIRRVVFVLEKGSTF